MLWETVALFGIPLAFIVGFTIGGEFRHRLFKGDRWYLEQTIYNLKRIIEIQDARIELFEKQQPAPGPASSDASLKLN